MKAKARKSKQGQHGQTATPTPAVSQPPRGGLRLPKWLLFVGCIALVAGVTFVVFEFVLPGRVPPELAGKWRVVGGPMDGTVFEFQRNGTMIGRRPMGDREGRIEGTAEVIDQTLRTTTTNPYTGRTETGTQIIVTLTETEFVTEDARGTRVTMTRVR
jgi:uncharacterized protein (TIGR03066 family)